MKILYIHGLNGSLSPEKREILEQFGEVFSPAINYEANPKAIEDLIQSFKSKDIKIVMGSSMGGFSGYYVSNSLQCPALLFNPALAERTVYQIVPDITNKKSSYKQIVLGTQDDIVKPRKTLNFLAETLMLQPQYKIHVHNNLAHRIPLDIFEEEVNLFFQQLTL
ncbi:YqiA/YcfP family alpha/beta fold hydrolase [Oceanihabitans sediminis]|uniref:Alpha/beta hydrolase n=1 Tax=Oceanihabitans sediminis TaxID=1812012 RepID=A0A368P726_9FLAO|nr:YqiA/YcfP family alpha/beta fold hydrolase [Oceanihabitans sediminis]MDX1278199.1 YqiA/YcfP family alpha/beta fold hydrolase [Oceanihabitans sediminis]MDX1773942.1 YqiA/YcfP family alpha/beta fold hydrolase [Oceanihabitans sediminis]RBP32032.1 hypothetical protein DFR65_10367 [Oceanihabitans sediminis]RCU58687.1 alpha/beta hydrolase [Oceanihabitans sediminis]